MLARIASVVASLFLLSACSGCAKDASQRVSQPAPSPTPQPLIAPTEIAAAAAAKPRAPIEAYVVMEVDDESWVLTAPLPRGAAKGARRSIELGGRKLLVKNEEPVATPMTFTLYGAANDSRCLAPATSHAIVHLSDAKHSWDAYRVKPCSGRNSFIALRGVHENVSWVEPKVVEIASPKDVRAYQVSFEGVAAKMTEITTLGRDRQCTHALSFSVSITTDDGMVDLENASVRGAVLVDESAFVFLGDPRAPGNLKVVRIANGRSDSIFEGELDNHQDGVDCIRG